MRNRQLVLIVLSVYTLCGCAQNGAVIRGNKIPASVELKSRPFYMGFTPWPYDYTPKAVEETYSTLREHGDLTAHHFDGGIPWDEALKGKPYHRKVRSEIEFRKLHTPEGHRVYIALTPLSAGRDGLAGYWAESNNMQLPEKWRNKRFNDPKTIAAYLNHCRSMIGHFEPDYAAYGIEVNMLTEKRPGRFDEYLAMTGAVYRALKQEYPDLPLFLTLQLESFIKDPRTQRDAVERLLPFTDYIAVSSYPLLSGRESESLPDDWFSQLADIAREKPFAVSETGYIAEELVSQQFGVRIPGSESSQEVYVRFLLQQCSRLGAEFVVWFFSMDYDAFWTRVKASGMDEHFMIWKDTGMIDEAGREREALKVWDQWLGLPRM